MIGNILSSFLELIFSINTLVTIITYLLICHLFIERVNTLLFSLIIRCFFAICFTFLFCNVFFANSQAFAVIISYRLLILVVLLFLSIILVVVGTDYLFIRYNIFPPFRGLFEVFWMVAVTQVIVLLNSNLIIIPPIDMLTIALLISLVISTFIGFFLISVSATEFENFGNTQQRGIVLYRLAGILTFYIPLLLYGGCIKILYK